MALCFRLVRLKDIVSDCGLCGAEAGARRRSGENAGERGEKQNQKRLDESFEFILISGLILLATSRYVACAYSQDV